MKGTGGGACAPRAALDPLPRANRDVEVPPLADPVRSSSIGHWIEFDQSCDESAIICAYSTISGRPGHCCYRCTLDPDWKHGGTDAPPGSAARTASRLTKRGGLKGTILAALVDVSCVSAVGTTVEKGEAMQGTVDLTISCARRNQPTCLLRFSTELNKSALCGADIRPAAGAWADSWLAGAAA